MSNGDADEVPAAAWPRVVTLKHPFDFGSERVTELTFRRGTMGDMAGIRLRDDIPADDLMKIAARMCGKTTNVLAKLDIDDVGEVTDIALDFYSAYLKPGKTRSR